jgi:hypothetical protein
MKQTVKPVVFTSKAIPAADLPSHRWSRTTLPTVPYQWETVWITDTSHAAKNFPAPPRAAYYHTDAIGDQLLRVDPGESDVFIEFARAFGLDEFLEWTHARNLIAWRTINNEYESGIRTFTTEAISTAWTDPTTVRIYRGEFSALRHAYDVAGRAREPDQILSEVIDLSDEQRSAARIELHRSGEGPPQLIMRPNDIFARAWLNLIESLTGRFLTPRTCANCGMIFTPSRADKIYCTDDCRLKANDQRRNQSRQRQAYKQKNQQKNRGTITGAEYDVWLDNEYKEG